MTRGHLTTLWKWLCIGCFAYVVGSVITVQGGVDVFGAKFLADAKMDGVAVIGYFSVIVGSFLMCLSLTIAMVYAWRHGRAWHERIPVVMLDGLKTGSIEGRIFQMTVVFVLVIVPLVGISRSMIVANEGVICEQTPAGATPIYYPGSQWLLLNPPSSQRQLRLMTRDTPPGICGSQGVEISWYTPILFGVIPTLVLVLFFAWLFVLFRSSSYGDGVDGASAGSASQGDSTP